MLNVVELKPKREFPDDLLTFGEVFHKYGYKYNFIYKWCVLENELLCYEKQSRRAIRESDLLEFMGRRQKKWRA